MPCGNSRGQRVHPGVDLGGHVERVGARRLEDREAGRLLAVEIEELAVGLRAELDTSDVAHPGQVATAAGFDDHGAELFGIVEAARHVERVLERLALRAPAARRSDRR